MISLTGCMCMNVFMYYPHVQTSACAHTYKCMWRPEVNTEYISQSLSALFFDASIFSKVPLKLELLFWLGWLASEPRGVPHPQSTGITNMWHYDPLFNGCWESELRCKYLCDNHLTNWAIFPAFFRDLQFFFKYWSVDTFYPFFEEIHNCLIVEIYL